MPRKNGDNFVEGLETALRFLGEMGVEDVFRERRREDIKPAPRPAPETRPPFEEPGDAEAALAALRDEVLVCRKCGLAEGRTNAVPGEGSARAELMFIGEGPGRDEDSQGRPFVGRAGQLLTKIIEAMGFSRSRVYIANIVKCRPPDNRVPRGDEVEACRPHILRQIAIIKPKIIVTLGKTAIDAFIPGLTGGMTSIRGQFREWNGIRLMPTFHPAYLIRNEGDKAIKRMVWEDMQQVMTALGRK